MTVKRQPISSTAENLEFILALHPIARLLLCHLDPCLCQFKVANRYPSPLGVEDFSWGSSASRELHTSTRFHRNCEKYDHGVFGSFEWYP